MVILKYISSNIFVYKSHKYFFFEGKSHKYLYNVK